MARKRKLTPERREFIKSLLEHYRLNDVQDVQELRKVTKPRTIIPTDDALFKILYLSMIDATKKWTGKTWNWGPTEQLCINFGDRIQPEDIG